MAEGPNTYFMANLFYSTTTIVLRLVLIRSLIERSMQAEQEMGRCGLTHREKWEKLTGSPSHMQILHLHLLIKHYTVNGNLIWDHFLTVCLTHALKPFFCTLNKTPRSRSLNCLLCLFALPAAPSSKDLFVHK